MNCALVAFPQSGSLYKFIYEVQVCAAQTVIVRSDSRTLPVISIAVGRYGVMHEPWYSASFLLQYCFCGLASSRMKSFHVKLWKKIDVGSMRLSPFRGMTSLSVFVFPVV